MKLSTGNCKKWWVDTEWRLALDPGVARNQSHQFLASENQGEMDAREGQCLQLKHLSQFSAPQWDFETTSACFHLTFSWRKSAQSKTFFLTPQLGEAKEIFSRMEHQTFDKNLRSTEVFNSCHRYGLLFYDVTSMPATACKLRIDRGLQKSFTSLVTARPNGGLASFEAWAKVFSCQTPFTSTRGYYKFQIIWDSLSLFEKAQNGFWRSKRLTVYQSTMSLQRRHASACEDVGFWFVFALGSINCESFWTSKTLWVISKRLRTWAIPIE